MNDVQILVDALAASLDRPIGVDDSRFRLVAHSAHAYDVDTVRLAKLLQREASADVTAWLEQHGVRGPDTFVRIPGCPRLEMAARIVVPLRFDGELLGFLALMDEPDPYTEDEIAEALRYVPDLCIALYRQRRLHLDDRDPAAAVARRLLGLPNDAEPESVPAPAELLVPRRSGFACLVAKAVSVAPAAATPTRSGVRLAASVERLRQTCGIRQALALAEDEFSVAIVAVDSEQELQRLAERLLADLESRFADQPECRAVVGLGSRVGQVDDVRESFEEATAAAAVASMLDGHGSAAIWGRLGADGTIARLLDESDPGDAIPESVRKLIDHPDDGALIETIEAYLDNGADTGATAAELYVHRTSLYHRLRRVEDITGLDLSTGDGRLEMHLGLRLWRMATGARRLTAYDAEPAPAT
ncbi:MAG: PucR family transcriptional regulator [Pirellulales bacterium]